MKIDKKNIVFIVIMVLCLCVSKAQAGESQDDLVNKQEFLSLITDNTAKPEDLHKDWNSRNPFDSSTVQVQEESNGDGDVKSGLLLQGIFLGSDKPSVIINGSVVGIGEKFRQWIVQEIKENAVVLSDNTGNKRTLFLRK